MYLGDAGLGELLDVAAVPNEDKLSWLAGFEKVVLSCGVSNDEAELESPPLFWGVPTLEFGLELEGCEEAELTQLGTAPLSFRESCISVIRL